jgi:FkbM family methyltransferase
MKTLSRITRWINSVAISLEQLGIVNTIKIFLWCRITNKPLTISLPNGYLFTFEGRFDQGVLSHFYKEGYFIEDIESQRIATIVDAGANIGDETARFLVHYPNAQIVAIEAAERNFALLQKNFQKMPNVELIKGAVWPVKANLKVVPGSSMESFRVIETPDTHESILAWSIQDIIEKMGWDRIDILKLDIEGSEYELFTRNYEEWIGKVNVFIFEVPDNDRAGTTQAIYRSLNEYKYNTFICGENVVLIRSDIPWKLRIVIGFNG